MQENLFLSTSAALEEIQFAIIQAKKKKSMLMVKTETLLEMMHIKLSHFIILNKHGNREKRRR